MMSGLLWVVKIGIEFAEKKIRCFKKLRLFLYPNQMDGTSVHVVLRPVHVFLKFVHVYELSIHVYEGFKQVDEV